MSSLLLHSHAVSAYDAVWTVTSAWNSVLTQLNCEEEYMNVTDKLISALANISVSLFGDETLFVMKLLW